ncbi:MAG: histidine-type phosphatase, partial [Muribaculaceae bacterium]|nr:histidine-type phosphatase [Muribaculaceae bacterium]
MTFSIKRIGLLSAAVCLALTSQAKDIRSEMLSNPDKCGGVYYAYPIASDSTVRSTPAPKGYKPFYISQYVRHGSRYL